MATASEVSAAEKKRKRLEAWRKRKQEQQQKQESKSVIAPPPTPPPQAAPAVRISMSLGGVIGRKKSKNKKKVAPKPLKTTAVPKLFSADASDDEDGSRKNKRPHSSLGLDFSLDEKEEEKPRKRRNKGRWDSAPEKAPVPTEAQPSQTDMEDAMDKFMEKLEAGAMGTVATQIDDKTGADLLSIDVGGSMMRVPKIKAAVPFSPLSGASITPEEIANLSKPVSDRKKRDQDALYTESDWESDAQGGISEAETDDEEEESARRAFIEALKSAPEPGATLEGPSIQPVQLAAEVKTEKSRREERLRELEEEAEEARKSAAKADAPEIGRLYNDIEGGVMEEAERNLGAAKSAPDALQVLAELNKKKELKSVDHSKIEYIPFKKNLYIIPRSLSSLDRDEIEDIRAKMKVKVRGRGVPAPVTSFEQCGLSERILNVLRADEITEPFPIQSQCLPCILAGRDVIGIAKTGSGKTLAYLLPLLRHISDQPPLSVGESGPIGLILAPARELAYQIHLVCKGFTKKLGLKSTAVYGGAAVAEQIGDLKRGTHVCVATPGRLIDILTMQSGKILSLQRVTYVVMDEADRMYDMGFAPQISAILSAVRPDRQTVLFSATFPKMVESLARKSLKYPVEVLVGGRSVASDNVTQYAELVEESDKFFRLLQLLGEHAEDGKKVLVFVDTQVRADSLFEQLLRNGYPSLSLHGGKEQEDRDSTISDFKKKDGPSVLVATGVAGRGLDVSSCGCVINYSCPNHLEAYVHAVGRTGRANKKGVAYTFVNSSDEAKYAPNIVRALSESGQAENVSPELKELSDDFKEKVKQGEAKYAGSGFSGKGYTYDASEMNDAQKLARLEKNQALVEAGLLDPDDEDFAMTNENDASKAAQINSAVDAIDQVASSSENHNNKPKTEAEKALDLNTKLTPELLALPGMKDAILKRAGIVKEDAGDAPLVHPVKMGDNHFVQEFEINDYPQKARWKVTQKETTSRLQDEFQTAVTMKGVHVSSGRPLESGERKLYLHLEAASEQILLNCVLEIRRMLNEETLRVGANAMSSRSSHKYNVLG